MSGHRLKKPKAPSTNSDDVVKLIEKVLYSSALLPFTTPYHREICCQGHGGADFLKYKCRVQLSILLIFSTISDGEKLAFTQ